MSLTIPELKAWFQARGIAYLSYAKRAGLVKLYTEHARKIQGRAGAMPVSGPSRSSSTTLGKGGPNKALTWHALMDL